MKKILLLLGVSLLANNSFATIGVSCGTEGHDVTYVYADTYIPSVSTSPRVHSAAVEGVEIDPSTVYIDMLELDTKCEEGGYQEAGCRMYMKVDLNGNGKYEFEYEVWRQEASAEELEEGGVTYYGRFIDYRSGKKTYLDASCSISN